jgi:hypothetical protein
MSRFIRQGFHSCEKIKKKVDNASKQKGSGDGKGFSKKRKE